MWTIFCWSYFGGTCNYSVRKLYNDYSILFDLLLCVSDSVPIHSTPVCGIHLHQSSISFFIGYFVGPKEIASAIHSLGGGFKYFYFHPYLGKISILTNIFQMGWFNHQPVQLLGTLPLPPKRFRCQPGFAKIVCTKDPRFGSSALDRALDAGKDRWM